jgi:tetratricopeptide (TPR) repeat protein
MAIKGSLREASLPDVIQLLALGRKTGCLAIADRQNFGYIYFDEGLITFAAIVNRRDRLGDLLVRNGKLAPAELQRAIGIQERDRDRKLGEILVTEGFLSRADLEAYVRLQIEEAVYFLFTWSQGTFNFDAGVIPEGEDLLVSIPPESLLMEAARRVDEWGLIEKKLPSFDLIFALDREHLEGAGVGLSPEQLRIVALLDGERDFRQVIEESGLVEFEAGKALYGLLTAGFARRVGTSAAAATPRLSDARIDEHRNLGVAFFKAGMLDEAQREFRRVAELRPSEGAAPFYLGLIALRQADWAEAAVAFRLSAERGGPRPAVLHNLALALLRLGRVDEAEAAWGEAVSRSREEPLLQLGAAWAALGREAWDAAASRLDRARALWEGKALPASWYQAAALAAAGGGDPVRALEVAREGLAAHPTHPVLLNTVAVGLELSGETAEAERALRTAFAEQPALPQVSKNLGDVLYRAGRYDDAAEAYERAARLAPELGDDLWFRLGNIAYKRRQPDRARECWERAAALNPAHELVRANLDLLGGAA